MFVSDNGHLAKECQNDVMRWVPQYQYDVSDSDVRVVPQCHYDVIRGVPQCQYDVIRGVPQCQYDVIRGVPPCQYDVIGSG